VNQPKPVLFFDVIETIFSLEALASAFQSEGLPAHAKDLFFAQLLRDAFAVSAINAYVPFLEMAQGTLQVFLKNFQTGYAAEPASHVIERILPAFGRLDAHPDVEEALSLAKKRGLKVVFFTNGSEKNTAALIDRNDLGSLVDQVISVDSFSQWKPGKDAYLEAIREAGGEPGHCAMIAAHAWDNNGASNVGLLTGWIGRQDGAFHPAMATPTFQSDNLITLVRKMSDRLRAADI